VLTYLPSFEEDATDIWRHVAADDPVAADRLIEQVWRRCLSLADHPMAGRARPEIAAECRHLVVGPLLVLYRVDGDRVDLVRLIHGRRRLDPTLF
jgi:toxin ParE1/3/4